MKRQSQCERMEAAMASGRWTPNEVFIKMSIPDYRRRMCDLNEKYPGRYDWRKRKRRRKDGTTYTMKDWRDLWATADFLDRVMPQLAEAEEWESDHDLDTAEIVSVAYKGEPMYLTRGQLRLYGIREAAQMLFERYVDPWRGEGVLD